MMANQARDQAMKIAVVITDGRSANSTSTIQEAVYARQVWGSVHFTLFSTLDRSLCWGSIQFTLLHTLNRSLYWGSIQLTLFPYLRLVSILEFYTVYPVPYLGQVSMLRFSTFYRFVPSTGLHTEMTVLVLF